MKPSIFKHGDAWALYYPGYGFSDGAAVLFPTWREAIKRATQPGFESGSTGHLEMSPNVLFLDDSI